MAKGGKGGKSGARGAKRGMRKQKKYGQSDFARVVHVLQNEYPLPSTGSGNAGSPSQAFGFYNFSLSMSPRASAVAAGFQEYRIAKVECIVKPVADTFISGNVAVATTDYSIPHLVYLIDKTATFDSVATNSAALKQAGAKPIRLDDKNIVIRWKPAIQIGSSEVLPGPAPTSELSASYRTSPWITTNANAGQAAAPWQANSVDHMGLVVSAETPRGPSSQVASLSFRITYEFRKPLWQVVPSAPGNEMIKVDLEKLGKDVFNAQV